MRRHMPFILMLICLLIAVCGCSSEADKICQAFDNGEYKTIRQASKAMAELGPEHVDDMARILSKDSNSKHKQIAALSLKSLEEDALPALDELILAVESDDRKVRRRAIEAIGAIGPDAADALDALRFALQDESHRVRNAAAKAIGNLEISGRPAALDLVSMLDNPQKSSGREAISALKKIDVPPDEILPEIMYRLDDPDQHVRGAALDALTRLDIRDKSILPKVEELIMDPERPIRSNALRLYRELDGDIDKIVRSAMAKLSDEDSEARLIGCSILKNLGSDAEPAKDRLRELLNDPDRKVAREAKAALGILDRAEPSSGVYVRFGKVEGLDARSTRRSLREHIDRLSECVSDSDYKAKSELVIEISSAGEVETVSFDPTLEKRSIQTCIEEAFGEIDLGNQAASGKVHATMYINRAPDRVRPIFQLPGAMQEKPATEGLSFSIMGGAEAPEAGSGPEEPAGESEDNEEAVE